MTTPNLDLWQRASHAQMGRGLDRANSESLQLRSILDDEDPIHVAFMSGMGYILGLVYHELEYQHRLTKSRNFASVTDQALATLANLKEAAMPVQSAQVDQKLTELQIAPPSEPSPGERVVIPGGIRECIVLRARGFSARLSQAGELTIAVSEMSKVARLGIRVGTGTWLEDGRRLIGRGA